MIVKLLTEHNLEFLSLKGGCTGSFESTLVKCHIVVNHMPQHNRERSDCSFGSSLIRVYIECFYENH